MRRSFKKRSLHYGTVDRDFSPFDKLRVEMTDGIRVIPRLDEGSLEPRSKEEIVH